MYPNVPVYNGSGSTDDQANFTCQVQNSDPLIDKLKIGNQFKTVRRPIAMPINLAIQIHSGVASRPRR